VYIYPYAFRKKPVPLTEKSGTNLRNHFESIDGNLRRYSLLPFNPEAGTFWFGADNPEADRRVYDV
jgi:hypothetical protein